MTNFSDLFSGDFLISDGVIQINTPFTGNTVSVEVDFNTTLDRSGVKLGILYVYSGEISHGYRLDFKQTILALPITSVSNLRFIPTLDLYDSYSLSLKYATVGSVIESPDSQPLPELITGLPNRVTTLESIAVTQSSRLDEIQGNLDGMVAPTWDNLTGKPLTFPPSAHIHSISEVANLATSLVSLGSDIDSAELSILDLTSRVNTLESNPVASSTSFIPINTNQVLEANKGYVSTANNLVCTLPANPAIGDFIDLVNGNFASFKINHGNTSQSILNSNTQTTVGSDSGIILKPYASIRLVFMGANLWVSHNRNRTINNFSPIVSESTASLKSYTVTSPNANLNFGTTLNSIRNGIKQPTGNFQTDGLLHETSSLILDITTNEPIILDSFNLFNGQGNVNQGATSDYSVGSCQVLVNGQVVQNYTFTNQTGVQQSRNLPANLSPSASYQFIFNAVSGSNRLGILELELIGRGSTGGEVSVI